ncbi:MAG: type II toxin-antitoxin system HicA family toxin [Lachnospiraceae bacterium]|nr:type II toxin-antitoxin system HicA family toxin [Lachnospiraceae bacterium]
MDMNGKELVKLLKRNGWKEERIESSHHIMRKDGKQISVPVHGTKSVKKGLLCAILKEAGINL